MVRRSLLHHCSRLILITRYISVHATRCVCLCVCACVCVCVCVCVRVCVHACMWHCTLYDARTVIKSHIHVHVFGVGHDCL